jgi:hypothetical protein
MNRDWRRRRAVLGALAVVAVVALGAGCAPPRSTAGVGPALTTTPTLRPTAQPTPEAYLPIAQRSDLPDLIVASMSISLDTDCLAPNSRLGLRVILANTGGAVAGPFVVEANGAQQTASAGLGAGQSAALWFAGYQNGTPNTAIVDATGLIAESDETNNQLSQMVPVPTPPLPCPPTLTATPTPTTTPPASPILPTINTGPATLTPTGDGD